MKERTNLKGLFTIDSCVPGPHVLIIAGIHGDEYEPILSAMELARILPDVLDEGKVTCCPLANQDAYMRGARCGTDNVDLARTCPGSEIGSPTEVVAHGISQLIATSDYLIDMHTGGNIHDIYPMAGYMLHPEGDVLAQQQAMALATGLPLIWGTDFRPDGRTLSVARDQQIPAIYFEYGGGSGFREQVVQQYNRSVLGVLNHLGMVKRDAIKKPGSHLYWVEDYRHDSGIFQAKMPALADGIFVPAVRVGEQVSQGQFLGRIVNPITGQVDQLRAEIDGLIHFLRTSVRVRQGDSLGGILPVKTNEKVLIYE